MKKYLLIGAVLVVIALALKQLVPRLLVKEKTQSEKGRDQIIDGIAAIANAARIPVIATTGNQPMRTTQFNPVYSNPMVYGLSGATRNPKDTGNKALSVSGAQKTQVAGGSWRSWLGFNP